MNNPERIIVSSWNITSQSSMPCVSFSIIFQVFHRNILSSEHCLPFTFRVPKYCFLQKKLVQICFSNKYYVGYCYQIYFSFTFLLLWKKIQTNSNLDGRMWYFTYISRSQARKQRQEMNEETWKNITYRLSLHDLPSYFSYTNQFHLLRDDIIHNVLGPLTPNSNQS